MISLTNSYLITMTKVYSLVSMIILPFYLNALPFCLFLKSFISLTMECVVIAALNVFKQVKEGENLR